MKVSIIVLTYNRAKFLREALASVFSQTFQDFEVIVGDDGSTDETREVIKEFSGDPRLVYSGGDHVYLVKNRERTIAKARGKYIATLDDDDIWADPEKLEKQVKFLEENPEYAVVGTGAIIIDLEGRELYKFLNTETDSAIRKQMLFRNPFFASSTLFRRDVFEEVGGYDNTVKGGEDWDLWLKIGKEGKMHNLPFYGLKYRLPPKNPHRLINMKEAIRFDKKYCNDYPGFYRALLLNYFKLCYTLLPRPAFLEKWLVRLRYTKNFKI